ncbi:hypothetical protein CSUI_001346 [Cystoisospora suis]|uniref:Uncharacterized protein n=1 Tax=Cystoisospora suis TaxID=483139 RepID=A0A2C6LC19_9APIC|nr:hypothetical protein CSUI_001346 [Cystoisospora suis]
MSYNPTYGGQFAGISAARKTDDSAKKDSKWIKQGGGAGSSAASAARPGGSGTDPLASDTPPTKVIVKISSLTFVGMPEVKAPDSRHFFVAAVFENDDLNENLQPFFQRLLCRKQNEQEHSHRFCHEIQRV